jgi:hypothetical protein
MKFLVLPTLLLAVTSLVVIGGAVFALLLFFPLALLALVGVLGGLKDRAVRQHNPGTNGMGWRNGG